MTNSVDEIASLLAKQASQTSGEFSYMLVQLTAITRELGQGLNGGHFDAGYVTDKAEKLIAAAKRIK